MSALQLELVVQDMPRMLARVAVLLSHRVGPVRELTARCEDGTFGRIVVSLPTTSRDSIDLLVRQLGRLVGVISIGLSEAPSSN